MPNILSKCEKQFNGKKGLRMSGRMREDGKTRKRENEKTGRRENGKTGKREDEKTRERENETMSGWTRGV